jgi:hypothetical protein
LIGPLVPEPPEAAFVPVEVEHTSGIEIIVGDVTIRLSPGVSPEWLSGDIRAVRAVDARGSLTPPMKLSNMLILHLE